MRRAPDRGSVGVGELAWRVYAFQVADEAIPFFAFYTLLFAQHGMSYGRIGMLLVIWSAASVVLEVPSGALADVVDRRVLLTVAPLLRACGFVLWVAWPTFAGFALGFVLWSAKSALVSGTLEALVYDQLSTLAATASYGRIIARARSLSIVGTLVATAAAGSIFALGGYGLVAAISVVGDLVGAAVAASLPAPKVTMPRTDGLRWFQEYVATLRAGVSEATGRPVVRLIVLLTCLVAGLNIVDEYVPLLARADGLSDWLVPYALLPTVALMAVGGLLAERGTDLAPARLGALLFGAGVVLVLGALWRSPVALVVIAGFEGVLQFVMVVLEISLQHAIEGRARATVTSVAGLGSEVVGMAAFAAYGAAASAYGLHVGTALLFFALLPAIAGMLAWARLSSQPNPARSSS